MDRALIMKFVDTKEGQDAKTRIGIKDSYVLLLDIDVHENGTIVGRLKRLVIIFITTKLRGIYMGWLQSAIAWIVKQLGIKPTMNKVLDYADDAANMTETPYDDMGVNALRAAVNAPEYKIFPIMKAIGDQGMKDALATRHKVDDAGFFVISSIGNAGDASMQTLSKSFIEGLKIYAASTETEIDDKAVDLIETILKETKVVK